MTEWHDIRKTLPPDDTWVLVRNSAGCYAVVNDICENKELEEFDGWASTPEEYRIVIRGFDEWAMIE